MEKLSNAERAAELVYDGMRKGTMPRDEFCRRLGALDQLGVQGVIASSYCIWLLLRNQRASPEKEAHMHALTARLRAALDEANRAAHRTEVERGGLQSQGVRSRGH